MATFARLAESGYWLSRAAEVALGATMLAWISHLGWFQPEQSSGGGDAVSFNWHPLLMTLAFPLAMTEGMMAYKLEHDHGVSHGTSKRVHGSLQGASLLFAAIGVALVFVNHEQKGIPHLYSAHSWLGIATLTLLIVQAGIAALLFGTPSFFSEDTRHIALPFHRFFGHAAHLTAFATMAMGLAEKQLFVACEGSPYCPEKFLAGLCVLILAFLAWCSSFAVQAGRDKHSGAESERLL